MSQLQVTGEAKIRDIQGPVVANSGVITALDGAASQYVRGDGTLADFPTSTGGGSSVSYYLNSSVSQGTIGGNAYRQLSKTPISGAGTDITASTNGYIANYITDANDPSLLEVPAGNFNCEFYFSVNSNNHNPYVYAELYKYDGTTFTLLGSNQAIPEYLSNGTTLSAYYFAIPVAVSALALTDRLAIRIYANVDTTTVTLHTENNHLCQVVTTFSKGLTSLNNLTRQVQFLGTGTSGTDFNIASSVATHTFNLPVASATNTGKLSSTDWSTFNNKVPYTGATGDVNLGLYNISAQNAFLNGVSGVNGGNLFLRQDVDFGQSAGYTTLYSTGKNLGFVSYVGSFTYNALFSLNSLTNNSTRTYTLPDASGTIALTSNINYPVTSVFGRTGAVVAQSGDYTTTQVTEGTNLYYTDARARAALSFTAGSGAYNSTTGVITIPTDNNQIANGAGYITSSALSGYLPLTGGTLTGGLNGTTATFSGLGTFYQLTMTGATAGRLFYAQTGGVFSQSGNLVWNNSTEQLGVGTPNPSAVVTAFSTNAATQLKAAGTAPAITFSNTLTSASLACVFGLATANNHFVTGTAAGDMAIANQSTSPGAIIFGTGTFEKMRMTAAGTFSIGNTNSTYNLDVTGTGRFTSTLLLGGALSGTSASFSNNGLFGGSNNAGNAATYTISVGLAGTNTGGIQLWSPTNSAHYIQFGDGISAADNYRGYVGYNHATDTLSLGTASADRLTIASTGAATFSSSVTATQGIFSLSTSGGAIGSVKNLVALNTNESIGNWSGISFSYSNSGTNFGYIGTVLTTDVSNSLADLVFGVKASNTVTAVTEYMRIKGGGNVGIGTSSPTNILTVQANDTFNQDSSGQIVIRGASNTAKRLGIGFDTTNNYGYVQAIETGVSTRALVLQPFGGDVCIGTTTVNDKLTINGGVRSIGSSAGYFWNDRSNASNFYGWYTTSNTIYLFNGTANAASINPATGIYTPLSDINKKKDFEESTIGLNAILGLKPTLYRMKTDNESVEKQLGFIAQEVKEFIPQAYVESGEGDNKFIGLNDRPIIAALVKAIQEQQAQIEELKALINK